MSTTSTLARGSDKTRRKSKKRTRTVQVATVNLDVDETSTHYLIFVSPRAEAQALGISYHRSRLPKCTCGFSGQVNRCRWCGKWSAEGMARYVGRLLRSYPKTRVRVTSVLLERLDGSERWQVVAAVPVAA